LLGSAAGSGEVSQRFGSVLFSLAAVLLAIADVNNNPGLASRTLERAVGALRSSGTPHNIQHAVLLCFHYDNFDVLVDIWENELGEKELSNTTLENIERCMQVKPTFLAEHLFPYYIRKRDYAKLMQYGETPSGEMSALRQRLCNVLESFLGAHPRLLLLHYMRHGQGLRAAELVLEVDAMWCRELEAPGRQSLNDERRRLLSLAVLSAFSSSESASPKWKAVAEEAQFRLWLIHQEHALEERLRDRRVLAKAYSPLSQADMVELWLQCGAVEDYMQALQVYWKGSARNHALLETVLNTAVQQSLFSCQQDDEPNDTMKEHYAKEQILYQVAAILSNAGVPDLEATVQYEALRQLAEFVSSSVGAVPPEKRESAALLTRLVRQLL